MAWITVLREKYTAEGWTPMRKLSFSTHDAEVMDKYNLQSSNYADIVDECYTRFTRRAYGRGCLVHGDIAVVDVTVER